MTASKETSNALAKDTGRILDKIQGYSLMYPDATFYEVESELEAAQILTAMMAMIRQTAKSVQHKADKAQYLQVANGYQVAVKQGKALSTFRDMTEDDQLEIYGLRLVARKVSEPESQIITH